MGIGLMSPYPPWQHPQQLPLGPHLQYLRSGPANLWQHLPLLVTGLQRHPSLPGTTLPNGAALQTGTNFFPDLLNKIKKYKKEKKKKNQFLGKKKKKKKKKKKS